MKKPANYDRVAPSSKAQPAIRVSDLTVIGAALGYKCVIVIPETQTQEKKDTLRLLGARLVEVPRRPLPQPKQLHKVFCAAG